jgi:glycerophosphoryl diester phosphodiesterase
MSLRTPAILAMAGALLATSTAIGADTPGRTPVLVIGHRGARAVRPENTPAAFTYALHAGVDAIELDLAVTRDDRLVVVHDPQVNGDLCLGPDGKRITERTAIRALTLAELRRLDCGTLRNPRFPDQVPVPGQRIPTFEEAIALVRGATGPTAATVRLLVEMKTVPGRPDLGPPPNRLANLLVVAVRASGFADRITLQSFDHRVLVAVRALDPTIALSALVGENRLADPVAVAKAAGAGVLAPHHEWIGVADVRALHEAGIRVLPWTANGAAAWDRLLDLGVDGIITDDPAGLIGHLRGKGLR